ncbi:MAG: oxygenase MpaB family protein [Stellaceae bacterium]
MTLLLPPLRRGVRPLLVRRLDRLAENLMRPDGVPAADFALPHGEPALAAPDSVSWRIFKNPVALVVGGVAAVILELAEPAVRTGVWEHSSFRADPVARLQRTGLAAMITVYGAKSVAEAMIAHVVRLHDQVGGVTPAGEPYRASDVRLLDWVQATASFGFAAAYHRYVHPLDHAEFDRLYREGVSTARLYGAVGAPTSTAELDGLFDSMKGRLEASPIIFEFLAIMRKAPVFPALLRPLQRLLVGAAVDITPPWVRARLGLGEDYGLRPWQAALVGRAGALADRIMLPAAPPAQSCLRLDLPADYLYRR